MIEWDIACRLVTAVGTIYFNDPSPPDPQAGYYVLDQTGCKATRELRVVSDKVPQADGEIFHKRFRDGTQFTLAIQLWENESQIACDQVLREMYDQLTGCLDSLVNTPGRFYYQPSGYGDERILEACRYMTPLDVTWNNGLPTVTFTIDSPLPYVIDKTPITVGDTPNVVELPEDSMVTVTLPQFGVAFWPVIQVQGPFSTFGIVNNTVYDDFGVPLQIAYDSAQPGAPDVADGDYAEIVCFNETIYLNGNQANLKAGIVTDVTDYFYLRPGDNQIIIGSAAAIMLVNNAWAVA